MYLHCRFVLHNIFVSLVVMFKMSLSYTKTEVTTQAKLSKRGEVLMCSVNLLLTYCSCPFPMLTGKKKLISNIVLTCMSASLPLVLFPLHLLFLIHTFLQISLLEFNLPYNFPERSFLIFSGENNEVNLNDCQELARLQSV